MKLFFVLLAMFSLSAWAGNAAWFRWESRLDGSFVCAQTLPSEGWKKVAGPYSDANCSKPR